MTKQESLEIVEKYISTIKAANQKNYLTSAENLAYERGILTGLLAQLITNDTYIRGLLIRIIERNKS